MRYRLMPWLALLPLAMAMPVHALPQLEVVAELAEGPGNITVTPEGRIVFSLHPFYAPAARVVELLSDGRLVPFPNADWSVRGSRDRVALDSVLGIHCDDRGVVWMLDNGRRGKTVPKVVGWDTRNNRLERVIHLPPPVTRENAFLNDLAVDTKRGAIYIADPASGTDAALIVVDLATGLAHRVLEGHKSLVPEDLDLMVNGSPVRIRKPDGTIAKPRVGVNPIALDAEQEWLYFGPMHATSLYRIRTADILNRVLRYPELGCCVERYSEKPICDGIAVGRDGAIYVSEVGANAIGVIGADRGYRRLVQDSRLLWPDALSFGPNGYLYTVANQLHRSGVLNGGEERVVPPFHVFRLKPTTQIGGRPD